MKRQNVDSTLAVSIGYDPKTFTLEIEFKPNGEVWQYYDVPETIYHDLINGSIGKFFNSNIKGQFEESKIE